MSLVKRAQELNDVLDIVIQSEGEVTPDVEKSLSLKENNLALAVDRRFTAIEMARHHVEFFKEQKKRYESAIKSLTNFVDWVKGDVKLAMLEMNQKELVGEEMRFTLSSTKPTVDVFSQDLLPSEYLREKLILEPDKEKIRAALELGIEVPGARLKENFSLRSSLNRGK